MQRAARTPGWHKLFKSPGPYHAVELWDGIRQADTRLLSEDEIAKGQKSYANRSKAVSRLLNKLEKQFKKEPPDDWAAEALEVAWERNQAGLRPRNLKDVWAGYYVPQDLAGAYGGPKSLSRGVSPITGTAMFLHNGKPGVVLYNKTPLLERRTEYARWNLGWDGGDNFYPFGQRMATTLRGKLVRLAHANPGPVRDAILPLLGE